MPDPEQIYITQTYGHSEIRDSTGVEVTGSKFIPEPIQAQRISWARRMFNAVKRLAPKKMP